MTAGQPKAYFLTWRTYGTWLPGDARGWVDERNNGYGEPTNRPDHRLEAAANGQMRSMPVEFSALERSRIDSIIREACDFRRWKILALNVRSNHVDLVVVADDPPASVMNAIKARVTRVLRERGQSNPGCDIWARGGSKRIRWEDSAVSAAMTYVLEGQ